jgi:hypothetical protein
MHFYSSILMRAKPLTRILQDSDHWMFAYMLYNVDALVLTPMSISNRYHK